MSTVPHDISDLYLAPVVLAIDSRLDELGRLDLVGLAYRAALESDIPGRTRDERDAALLGAVSHFIECHGWTLSWDSRGIRLTHDEHSLVLGVPPTFAEYLAGAATPSAAPRANVHS